MALKMLLAMQMLHTYVGTSNMQAAKESNNSNWYGNTNIYYHE